MARAGVPASSRLSSSPRTTSARRMSTSSSAVLPGRGDRHPRQPGRVVSGPARSRQEFTNAPYAEDQRLTGPRGEAQLYQELGPGLNDAELQSWAMAGAYQAVEPGISSLSGVFGGCVQAAREDA